MRCMKETLRHELLKKRQRIPIEEVHAKSKRIQKRLFAMPAFQKAHTVLFYVSYEKEVDTHAMIKESLALGKQVVVPCTDKKTKTLSLSVLRCWDDLCHGAYNILEPKKECRTNVSFESIDLVIVPGVAFDPHGNRLGHGMGYYDSLLRQFKDKPKIGLAFELQLLDHIPAEQHDIQVDTIVSEERVIVCNS